MPRGRQRQPPPTVPYIAKGKINSGLPTAIDNAVPDWAKACTTGWKEESLKKRKFDVLTEEEYNDEHMGRAVADSYVHVATSMASNLSHTAQDMNAANTISHLISERVFADICSYTSQQLVKRRLQPVSIYDFKRFYATKLLRSRFNLSTKKAWEAIMTSLAQTHGFTLMEYDRFNNILTCIRGYDVPSRSGDNGDEAWLRQKNLLRNLEDLEKAIFKRSMEILINTKSGALVVDDELVASRASDVEAKAFSDRKTGKDGAMADCLADSAICMLLGMRLRVVGEKQRDNVKELLKTLPTVTTRNPNKRARFSCDRGYTNEEFIGDDALDGYDAVAINNKAARNPFMGSDQWDEFIESCKTKKAFQVLDNARKPVKDAAGKVKIDEAKLKQVVDLCVPWVVDKGEMLGTEVRAAHKDVPTAVGGTKKLTALTVRDVFDKKNHCKDLPFLATGSSVRDKLNKFVAVRKASYVVTTEHLFSGRKASTHRLEVEEKLKANGCIALTVGQRDISWFVLKGFVLTGTNAGKVHARSSRLRTVHEPAELLYDTDDDDEMDEEDEDLEEEEQEEEGEEGEIAIADEVKRHALQKCLISWFGRNTVTTSAMAEGTKNEYPTAQNFASMEFVEQFYEAGLLNWTKAKNIGVSPDGIAQVKIPGQEYINLDSQLVSVEIKTRSKETTIAKAEAARDAVKAKSVHGDGKVVVCNYNDDTFKKCVPSENRKQVIHQALVTGLSWGVFIVAKVEEDQGSIVQVLFVHFTDEEKEKYERILLRLANPLNMWMFGQQVIDRGYLEPDDFPAWVSNEQRDIIESRFKMWSAFYTRAQVKAFIPVGQLKLSVNYEYNKQKWGLDMCTENYITVSFGAVSLLFESKYVLRMLDGIVANGWKVEQGHTLIQPYIDKYKEQHDGAYPTSEQIRTEARKLSLEDYTFELSVQWLKELEVERRAMIHEHELRRRRENNAAPVPSRDVEMLGVLERYQSQNNWPLKTDTMKKFSEDEELNKLRKYSSYLFTHPCERHDITETNKEGLKVCKLCSVGLKNGRKVRTFCSKCGATLCTKVKRDEGFETSCFEAWHTVDDLAAESKRRAEAVTRTRAAKRARRESAGGGQPQQPASQGDGATGNAATSQEESEIQVPNLPPMGGI